MQAVLPASDVAACAALVEKGDPDRFLAAMAAPPAARGALFALYAFNLELARIPWVTREPLIARMRLQFWREVVAGERPAAHEVAGPVQALLEAGPLRAESLVPMVEAREVEIGTQAPFADRAALWAYLEGTAGALMAAALEALGAPADPATAAAARDFGAAQGLANYLVAVPALEAAGRRAWPADMPAGATGDAGHVGELAREGQARIARARPALRGLPSPARAALLAGWRAEALLGRAAADPFAVAQGRLVQSEFARRGSLLWRSLRGM